MSQPGSGAASVDPAVDTHEYAMWDAAYVLGSLSSAERREFESHLRTCEPCRQAVAEISGMPALLSQLDRGDVAAIDEDGQSATPPPPPRPELLSALLEEVTWRRRRSRALTWAGAAAAAAVLVAGVLIRSRRSA